MNQGSNLRGSKPYWAARCAELTDMVEQLNLPTFFITPSCADSVVFMSRYRRWLNFFCIFQPRQRQWLHKEN